MAKSDEADSGGADKFLLRLPKGMRMRIERAAKENGRTLTAEILTALEQVFPSPSTTSEIYDNLAYYIERYKSGSAGDKTEDIEIVLSALGIDFRTLAPRNTKEKTAP